MVGLQAVRCLAPGYKALGVNIEDFFNQFFCLNFLSFFNDVLIILLYVLNLGNALSNLTCLEAEDGDKGAEHAIDGALASSDRV